MVFLGVFEGANCTCAGGCEYSVIEVPYPRLRSWESQTVGGLACCLVFGLGWSGKSSLGASGHECRMSNRSLIGTECKKSLASDFADLCTPLLPFSSTFTEQTIMPSNVTTYGV